MAKKTKTKRKANESGTVSSSPTKKTKRSSAKSREKADLSKFVKVNNLLSEGNHSNLHGYQKELEDLKSIVSNAIEHGQSNCVLICGGRGCGKTLLLENCLKQIKLNKRVHLIRLHGFIHGNDVNTIKFIAKQMDIDAKDITSIFDQLKKTVKESKSSIILILDEFDIFCRRNQTLLYNLFDVSQKCQSFCIIGMSSRLDCFELLEKRIKSRMNQRIIHLSSPFRDFDDYLQVAKDLLQGFDISDALSEELKKQFSLNKSFRSLKCLLSEHLSLLQHNPSHTKSAECDVKIKNISSLSTYEICLLMLALKYVRTQNSQTFNCVSIMEMIKRIPSIAHINRNILFKLMYNLLEVGLIVVQSPISKNVLFMSDWTLLTLNVDDCHLNSALQKYKDLLPLNIRQGLNF